MVRLLARSQSKLGFIDLAARSIFAALLPLALLGCRAPNRATPSTTSSPVAAPLKMLKSPTGKQFAVSQLDDTNPPERIIEPVLVAGAAPSPDIFKGNDRKAAKLSISGAQIENFDDLGELLDSLPKDQAMKNHSPEITEDADSDRAAEEQRNVKVRVWLYAAKKEADNDFHLIMGRDPTKSPRFMTMELGGLPKSGDPFRPRLKTVRDSFKAFFGTDLPGTKYDKYDPPIPVEVMGSLFFDVDHPAGAVGPTGLKPATAWEVHPVTDIVFEP